MTFKGQSLLAVFLLMRSAFSLQMSSGIVKNPNSNTAVNFNAVFVREPIVALVNLMQFSIEGLSINKNNQISITLDAEDIKQGRFILSASHSGFDKSFVLQVMYFASIGDPCIIGLHKLDITKPISEQQSFTKPVFSSPKFDASTTRVNVSTILSSYDFTIADISLGIGLSVQPSHQTGCKEHSNCSYHVPLKTSRQSPLSASGGLKFSVTPKGISVSRLVIIAVIVTTERKDQNPLLVRQASISISHPSHETMANFAKLDDKIIGRRIAFYGEESFSVAGPSNSNIVTVQKLKETTANSSNYQIYLYLSCQDNQALVNNTCICGNLDQNLTNATLQIKNFCKPCPAHCITCEKGICLTFHLKRISLFQEYGTECDRGYSKSEDQTYCECPAPMNITDGYFCRCPNPAQMYYKSELKTCVCWDPHSYVDNATCKRCWTTCNSCIGPTPNNCTSCINKQKFDLNDSSCLCKFGSYLVNNSNCDKCSETCESCSSKFSCSSCNSTHNRILENGRCMCLGGYYSTGSVVCQKCNSSCLTCISKDVCSSCDSAYKRVMNKGKCLCQNGTYQLNSTICQQCDSSCLTCNGSEVCTSCSEGKYLDAGVCKLCGSACLACTSKDPKNCTKCSIGHYLEAGVCKSCGPSCLECSQRNPNLCFKCQQGKYLVNWKCQACDPKCLTCMAMSWNCMSCRIEDNRVLKRRRRVAKCVCMEGFEEAKEGEKKGQCVKKTVVMMVGA